MPLEGNLDMWLVILFSTLGADVGATINYLAGWYLGRPIIYKFANSKWGHLCLLNQEKVEKSERYFEKHGMVAHYHRPPLARYSPSHLYPSRLIKDELLEVLALHYHWCGCMA